MGKHISLSGKFLGALIFAGLIIQFVFIHIKLGQYLWISTVLYLIVGIYLLILG